MMTRRMLLLPVLVLGAPAVAAAVLGGAASAGAADIPSTTQSRVALFSANNSLATQRYPFERAKDSDWFRVELEGGKDYYVTGLYGDQGDGSVLQSTFRDARGNVLVNGGSFDPFTDDGYEIRAPRTGTYFVEFRTTSSAGGKTYGARIGGDCASGTRTKCTMSPGQVRDKNVLGGAYDRDSFKLALTGGRTYTFFVGSQQGCASDIGISMLDSGGNLVASSEGVFLPEYDYAARLVFRAPRTGTFYATVGAVDDCQVLYRFRMR